RDRVPARVPLTPAVVALSELERHERGRWWCTGIDQTSPQLGFGSPDSAAHVFGDLRPELDPRVRSRWTWSWTCSPARSPPARRTTISPGPEESHDRSTVARHRASRRSQVSVLFEHRDRSSRLANGPLREGARVPVARSRSGVA